jgi:protein-S-isoprenylcysteine O-methyltransferase Ste14
MSSLWLILSWITYFALHSILALTSVKNFAYSTGMAPHRYRLIYNLLAVVLLIPIMIVSSHTQSSYLFEPSVLFKFLGLVLATWGLIIAKIAFRSYDTKAFLGLGKLDSENKLRTDGLLQHMRHPLYSGSMLLVLGYFVFDPKISTLISTAMIIIYIMVGIQFEEKKLIKTFGKAYLDYKRKTPMIIPRWNRNK